MYSGKEPPDPSGAAANVSNVSDGATGAMEEGINRTVIVVRDPMTGYGLTLGGEQPVYVQVCSLLTLPPNKETEKIPYLLYKIRSIRCIRIVYRLRQKVALGFIITYHSLSLQPTTPFSQSQILEGCYCTLQGPSALALIVASEALVER